MGTTILNRNTSLYTVATNNSFIQFAGFNSNIITAERDLLNTPTTDLFIDTNNKYTADLGINIISDLPRTIGEIPITSNFELLQAAPLDARTLARTEANMLSAAWWLGKSNNKPVYLYKGMVISTMDTGQVYIYTGSNLKITQDDDETNEYLKADNWSKVSGGKSEKDITSSLKYTSGNIDAPGYVLSADTDIFGITMTDYYTLLGGHIREDEDTSNAYCYTDYNACIVNANSNNVIHNFNGIYIPTKKAKNYFGESSNLLNSIILLNLNGGKITLLTIDIDNVPTGDSSISKDDIESIAQKSVLNLDTSYAELCLESNISAETPTRAGIKITRDAETLSTNVAIDASTLKINANKIYPWNNTAIIAPTSNDNNKIATYNAKDDNIYWQSFDNLKGGGNSYNGIVEANANYNRYVKIATTEVYSYIKVARQTDDTQTSTIHPQVLKNNGYINFNGNVNNVYSIDGSFKINVNTKLKRVTVSSSSINAYTEEIDAPILSYELSINNYKLGTNGLNTDISQFNLPVGVKVSDKPTLTKLSNSAEYNFRISWMVSLYLFVPSSSILEYYTYSEYWNNTNTDNPTSIIETGGELTFDSTNNILYANTLYDYSYDAGILNAALNYNLSVSARADKVTCIKPTYNYTVEYPAYKSDSNTLISLQDTPNIPWKYYNNNGSLGYGLIKARSLSNTNKVDFFADYDILSKLAFNNDISNIGAALIENGITLNAISLIMYMFKDAQQKILYLNNTIIKIIDLVGLDIDTSKDTDTDVYTGTGIIDDLSNRISLIDAGFVKVDTSLDSFFKSFGQINKDLVDLSALVNKNASTIDDVSEKNAENTSKINNINTSWVIFDDSINNKFRYIDISIDKFRRDIDTSFSTFKKFLDSSMHNFKQLLDSSFTNYKTYFDGSLLGWNNTINNDISNFKWYVNSSFTEFKGSINESISDFKDKVNVSLGNFNRTITDNLSIFDTSINAISSSLITFNSSLTNYFDDCVSTRIFPIINNLNTSLNDVSNNMVHKTLFLDYVGRINSSMYQVSTLLQQNIANTSSINDKVSNNTSNISNISNSILSGITQKIDYIDSCLFKYTNWLEDVSAKRLTPVELKVALHDSSIPNIIKSVSDYHSKILTLESSILNVSLRVANTSKDINDIQSAIDNVSQKTNDNEKNIGNISTFVNSSSYVLNIIPDLITNYQLSVNLNTNTLGSYITNINDNMNTLATTLTLTISDVSVISSAVAADSNIDSSTRLILNSSLIRPTLTVANTKYTFTAANATQRELVAGEEVSADDTSEP